MKQHRSVRLFIALIFAARPCLQITYSKNIEAPMKGKFWWVVTITLILYTNNISMISQFTTIQINFYLDYNLDNHLEYLNDALSKLKKAQRQKSKQPIFQKAQQGGIMQSVKDSMNRSTKGLNMKKHANDVISDVTSKGPSLTDTSCMQNYPISCISENWRNITCIVFVQHPSVPVQNTNTMWNDNPSLNLSTAKESQTCSNFYVHLENIE